MSERMGDDEIRMVRKYTPFPNVHSLCTEALRRGEEAEQWRSRAEAADRERREAVRLLRQGLDTLRHTSVRLGMLDVGANEVDLVAGRIDDFLRSLSTPHPRTAQTCAEESVPAETSQRDPLMPERVESKPGVMGGTPVIKGTRIPTSSINSLFQRGFDFDHIVRMYPSITKEDAFDAVRYEIRRGMANEEDTDSEEPTSLTAESVARALEAASKGFNAHILGPGRATTKLLRGARDACMGAARALREEREREGR